MKNLITFTQYKSPKALSKRYWLEGGLIHKQAAAQMTKGKATRVSLPFKELIPIFTELSPNEAFGYGIHAASLPNEVKIVVKGKESIDRDTVSRSLDFFTYKRAGISMIDHDPSEYGKSLTADELIALITEIHSEFEHCAKVIRGSVSAGVHLSGDEPSTSNGFHIYLPVLDASLIPGYGKLLSQHLWLNGHGYIALAANGSKLVRTCIDGSVFSPERLDFVGKPVLLGEGLSYTAPEPKYIDGGMLDLSTLPELDEADLSFVNDLIEAAKEAIDEDSKDKAEVWAVDKIAQMEVNGTEGAKARKIVYTMLGNDCKDIYDEFPLEFANGEVVTVADVVANHKKYDGKALADPIEGVAYGKTTAKFYWNNGKPFIYSFAHGESKYFLHSTIELMNAFSDTTKEKPKWKIEWDEHCAEWNKTHMSTLIGGQHRIARMEVGSAKYDGRDAIEFYRAEALSNVHRNKLIQTGTKVVNNAVTPVYSNHYEAWAKHTKSQSFTGGVTFLPNRKVPNNYYNTWQGYAVFPNDNNASLERIEYHIERIVCGGNAVLYEYLYKWIAYTFQCPDKPAGAAIVLRGEKGCGKGTLGSMLTDMWGNHGLHITNTKYLTGSFNGHLADVCFLFADEAFFSGDAQQANILKGLVTESTMTIERKGIDAITQPNYLKIFMATNSEYAVPATRDERRFFVTDVSSEHIGDRVYFNGLHADCSSDEVKSAFLYKMLNMDISGWSAAMIPESKGLRNQRYHSMTSVQKWLVDVLIHEQWGDIANDTNFGDGYGYGWHESLTSAALFVRYVAWCDTAKAGEYKRMTLTQMSKYLGQVFEAIRNTGGRGQRGYFFGGLFNARARFEAYEKIKLRELIIDS